MKHILTGLLMGLSLTVAAQTVTIGASAAAQPQTNQYVLLQFSTAENKGLILPYVDSQSAVDSNVTGTLIFDTTDNKVKVSTNSAAGNTAIASWFDLTGAPQSVNAAYTPAAGAYKLTGTDATTAKAVIGKSSSTANGILVLEQPATTPMAMVLPKVSDYTKILNPSPGMVVYTTNNKQLAVFNGKVWTFWKP